MRRRPRVLDRSLTTSATHQGKIVKALVRIVHLPSNYLPESLGGTEVYVRQLCQGLSDRGHESAVAWHTDVPPPEEWSGPELPVRLPPYLPQRRADLYRKAATQEPPGFRNFLSEWQPAVLHFHAFTLGAGCGHARVAKQLNIPYVITFHTPAQSCQRGTLLRFGVEACDGQLDPVRCAACSLHAKGWPKPAARLLSHSPLSCNWLEGPWTPRLAVKSLMSEAKDSWQEFFGGAAHIVACAEFCRDVISTNAVSAERISVHRQALPGDERQRPLRLPIQQSGLAVKLGFFGRFAPIKGPDLFVESVRLLRAEGVNVVAELAGPIAPPDRTWAESVLARGGQHVRHLGVLQGAHLADWLRTLDLAVLPSRCLETGPLTLLEAWDRGTPVIGTDLGGIRDFMTAAGLSEFLFAVNAPPSIAAAVRRALAWTRPAPVVTVPGVAALAGEMEDIYRQVI